MDGITIVVSAVGTVVSAAVSGWLVYYIRDSRAQAEWRGEVKAKLEVMDSRTVKLKQQIEDLPARCPVAARISFVESQVRVVIEHLLGKGNPGDEGADGPEKEH